MRRTSGTVACILAVAVMAVTVTGCDGNGTGPGGEGRINATVTVDGTPTSGVGLSLFAAGGTTAQATASTGGNGVASFEGLSAGGYEVEVTIPAGLELSAGQARRPVTVTAGGTAALTFALTSGENGGNGDNGDNGDGLVTVDLLDATFSPSTVTITPGTTVRWQNTSNMFHTITPQGHSEWLRHEMNQAGDTFEHTFTAEGDFPYFCEPHAATMTGVIQVRP